MSTELNRMSAIDLRRRLDSGAIKAESVVEACLDRIAAREPTVHAWIHLAADKARAEARRLDDGKKAGLLHGIPMGIKDIIETADMPTGSGAPISARHQPPPPGAPAAPAGNTAPRIGVCRTPYWDQAEPETAAALEEAAQRLSRAGAQVADIALPALYDKIQDSQTALSGFEAPRNHADELRRNAALLSTPITEKIDEGRAASLAQFRAARRRGEPSPATPSPPMGELDAPLTPTAPVERPCAG